MSEPFEPAQVLRSMLEFLRAPTWDESRRFLASHPELVNDAGCTLLEVMRSDAATVSMVYPGLGVVEREDRFRRRQQLLHRCWRLGVPAALAEVVDELDG